MDSNELLLEIGSKAYDDLDPRERTALMGKYTLAQTRIAGLHAFQILMKKFQPTYRMGKTYENLSEKFVAYRNIYNWYCQTVSAGTIATADIDNEVDKEKFLADEN
jgi:hypothetical protein